jgi:hypothetical protein
VNQPLAAILGNAEAAQKTLRRDDLDVQELRAICDDIVMEDNRARRSFAGSGRCTNTANVNCVRWT